jgi:hypothetical protein
MGFEEAGTAGFLNPEYDMGKSDAVKQQYWLYVSMQTRRNQVSSVPSLPRAIAGTAD